MSADAAVPGWHGKLPSLGDFASRRLDAGFIEPWDGWLAAGLLALREGDADGWLDAYLASPSWRFLLMPGVLPGAAGQGAWAGVLMPSVDRVGRYFPFTLALPLGDRPATTGQMQSLWHWLARLDDLAADALLEDWALDRLEAELARMAGPELDAVAEAPALPSASGAVAVWAQAPGLDAGAAIGAEAQALWRERAAGRAYWFASTELGGRRLLVSRGLPAAAAIGNLLGATI
ncbi:MAG: type VI secretion system-associated protein TagF [Burkholderiales bacterium]|nr:type VI secretion system-associated protein TagF [Burkholderiales bacterium]MDE2453835.1 type VI secretion system-associated protein TagF [Burkholderiales bacterium]